MAIYSPKVQPCVNDLYETPPATLDMILDCLDPLKHYIWEPFRGSGHSTRHMQSRGFVVTNGDHEDFFHQTVPPKSIVADNGNHLDLVLVSNPPFSIKRHILDRLTKLGVYNVALLLPAPVIFTKYFQEYCTNNNNLQLIIHTKRCSFLDPVTGEPTKKTASFDILWACINLGLDRDVAFSTAKDN